MINFSKKLAIAASLLALCSGQFVAFASNNNNDEDVAESALKRLAIVQASDDESQPMEFESSHVHSFALVNTVASATAASIRIQHDEFLPPLPAELKVFIANLVLAETSPLPCVQVCKAWHLFFLDRAFEVKAKEKIMAIPFFAHSSLARWLDQRDLQILNAGTFRYQPAGAPAIDVKLSTMLDTNDVLPADLAQLPICVTRNIETFVRPVGNNTQKTLVLLLPLSELKLVAQQISTDASFIQNVASADLLQNAVCALIRYGGDNIAKWGFRYTILSYGKITGLSIWQIFTHEKARLSDGEPCSAPVAFGPLRRGVIGGFVLSFFEPK
jgi:hypothetical protein